MSLSFCWNKIHSTRNLFFVLITEKDGSKKLNEIKLFELLYTKGLCAASLLFNSSHKNVLFVLKFTGWQYYILFVYLWFHFFHGILYCIQLSVSDFIVILLQPFKQYSNGIKHLSAIISFKYPLHCIVSSPFRIT